MEKGSVHLLEQIDSLLYSKDFDFKGLPESIVNGINELLLEFTKEELIVALIQLESDIEKEADVLRASKPSSGFADQFLMVAEMRCLYRQRAIDYLKNKETDNEK